MVWIWADIVLNRKREKKEQYFLHVKFPIGELDSRRQVKESTGVPVEEVTLNGTKGFKDWRGHL